MASLPLNKLFNKVRCPKGDQSTVLELLSVDLSSTIAINKPSQAEHHGT
jgi:hypothetical protein